MRVALIHLRQSGTGGTERHLNQIAAHLAERGDEVTIVCRSYERGPHPSVKFARLRPFSIGATWRMWSFARAVEQHVAANRYDVVYGLGKAWSHDAVRLGGGCHQTYLDLAHDQTRSSRWSRGWLKQRTTLAIEARALRPGAYRRVVVNSEMVKRDAMARHAIPAERIEVIYNGVDLDRFDRDRHALAANGLRRECGFADDDIVVLFLGSGYGRKGLAPLLEAFAEASREHPALRLMVVGYDSRQSWFEQQSQRLGLAEKVRFLGGRRDADVCYAAADLYALPTYYDPFANSTLEALASGLPVLTTSNNGAAEIVTPETGAVTPNDSRGTATLARQLIEWSARDRLTATRDVARVLAGRHPVSAMTRATAAMLDRVAEEKKP